MQSIITLAFLTEVVILRLRIVVHLLNEIVDILLFTIETERANLKDYNFLVRAGFNSFSNCLRCRLRPRASTQNPLMNVGVVG